MLAMGGIVQTPAQEHVQVGKTVRVTVEEGNRPFNEVLVGANQYDSRRLIACAQAYSTELMRDPGTEGVLKGGQTKRVITAYVSFDGGRTWKHGLTVPKLPPSGQVTYTEYITNQADPDCGVAPDGTFYLDGFYARAVSGPHVPKDMGPNTNFFYRSEDGKKWEVSYTPRVVGRGWVCADPTKGTRSGWVYAFRSGPQITVSEDTGRQWATPTVIPGSVPGAAYSDCDFLSDGTLLVPAASPNKDSYRYKIYSSSDGAKTFSSTDAPPYKEPFGLTTTAVDRSSGVFNDRIYRVWVEIVRQYNFPWGRLDIQTAIKVSYSADRGRSWSEPITINDDRPYVGEGVGPSHMLSAVAVNKDGVVGVLWYDRRGQPQRGGYMPRFRASLDGGETWLPSIAVTDQAHDPRRDVSRALGGAVDGPGGSTTLRPEGGIKSAGDTVSIELLTYDARPGNPGFVDTTGLTATSDGVFHPVWEDNRTGLAQLYTAPS